MMNEWSSFFEPRSIAFLGASNDKRKWGFRVLHHLVTGGYQGKIYPVNPKGEPIEGINVYKTVKDIPEVPDMAVIVVPIPGMFQAIRNCGQKGIKAGVVITAGFAEVGREGALLQEQMLETAKASGMRLIGPNCFGIMSTPQRLYAQMPNAFPPPGPIGVVSQSGNVGFTIASHALALDVGCSRVINTGNEADLKVEDFIEYLAGDNKTRVIMCYVEGFRNGRRFFEIATRAGLQKPLLMIKAGETEAGASAARSHTASLSGSDAVFHGICRQAGIIRAYNLQQLMNIGYGFLCHPLPRGNKVGIVTMGGGWGVLAADASAKYGLEVIKLSNELIKELDTFLPSWWSRNNPIDLAAGAPPEAFPRIIEMLARYEKTDAVIALGLPTTEILWSASAHKGADNKQKMTAAINKLTGFFQQVKDTSEKYAKPIICAADFPVPQDGDLSFKQGLMRNMARKNMVCYGMPDEAAMVLSSMVSYSRFRQLHKQR